MQRILVTISPEGAITLQTTGFTDGSCRDASRAMQQALGLVESDKPSTDSGTISATHHQHQVGKP